MSVPATLNKNNSAVKRIMQEARELANDPSTEYSAAPLEDNIFEWHCTLRGPTETDFEGGLYHFRILLPADYPFRPPSIMMLTPNGRFETGTKICISFTNYHEELWQPAWGVRTAIIGLMGFFPLKGQAAVGVGSMESSYAERKRLAVLSRKWVCPACHCSNEEHLPDPPANADSTNAEISIAPPASTEPSPDGTVAPPDTSFSPALETSQPILAEDATPTNVNNATPSIPPSQPPTIVGSMPSASAGTLSSSSSVHAPRDTPAAISAATSLTNNHSVSSSVSTSSTVPQQQRTVTRTTVPPHNTSKSPIVIDAAIAVLLSIIVAILSKRML